MASHRVLTLPDGEEEWNTLLSRVPSDIYFSPAYYRLFAEYQEGSPQCFVHEDEGRCSLFPHLLRPVPGTQYYDVATVYGYGGILTSTGAQNDQRYLNAVRERLDDYYRRARVIAEFVRYHPVLRTHDAALVPPVHVSPTITVETCSDPADIRRRYRGSNRRTIRDAKKAGLQFHVSEGSADLGKFADLYRKTMKRVDASEFYFFPEDLLERHASELGSRCILMHVMKDGQMLASSMFLSWHRFLHYHLSASNEDGRGLGANNLLLHGAIMWAHEEGYDTLHLGGGYDGEDGLYRYKKGFNRESDTSFHISRRIINQQVYDLVARDWLKSLSPGTTYDSTYFPVYRAPVVSE